MHLAIDACCWSNNRGFGRFTRELVTAMVQERRHELTLVVDRHTAATAKFPQPCRLQVVHTGRQPTRAATASGSRRLNDLWRMTRSVSSLVPDVFFFPAVYTYFPVVGSIPTVVTVHDCIADELPDKVFGSWQSRLLWNAKVRFAVRQAQKVLTVSEDARSRIAHRFHLSPAGIDVLSEGPASCFRPIDDKKAVTHALDRHQLPKDKPLLLYVGGVSPHKNLDGLLKAAAMMRQRGVDDWHLAIVGATDADGFLDCYRQLLSLRDELALKRHVTFTGFVPDDDLALLYNAAVCLVLPSWSEGFGLPIVEAMACGRAVACSNRGSLPEVAGSAAEYFDPASSPQTAEVLTRLLNDKTRRRELEHNALVQVQKYSWKQAARTVCNVVEELGREAAAA